MLIEQFLQERRVVAPITHDGWREYFGRASRTRTAHGYFASLFRYYQMRLHFFLQYTITITMTATTNKRAVV
jgi:hypothetical protein